MVDTCKYVNSLEQIGTEWQSKIRQARKAAREGHRRDDGPSNPKRVENEYCVGLKGGYKASLAMRMKAEAGHKNTKSKACITVSLPAGQRGMDKLGLGGRGRG